MLRILLSLCLLLSPQDGPKPPSQERVAQVVLDLKQSLKSGTEEQQVRLLTQASDVPAPAVVKLVAKSLKHKSPKLVSASIQGLRWMKHPAALKALQKAYGSQKALQKNEVHHLAMIKAIGQHADVSSIKMLTQETFASKNGPLVQARIYSLGMIRHKDAVTAFFKLLNSNGAKGIQRHMSGIRLSLMMLTGVDKGPKLDPWLNWWRDNQKSFKMAPISPAIPRQIRDNWTRYWGLEYMTDRVTRREDRGR